MATIVRPSMLRQMGFSAPVKRAFSTNAVRPSSRRISIRPILPARPSTIRSIPRDALQSSMRVAAFHASGKNAILPAGSQVIDGTTNDPAKIPEPHPMHGSYHWTFERLLSAGLIPLTLAPFVSGTLSPVTDAILCAAILIHSHVGFQAVVIDYIPTYHYPTTRKVFWWALRLATLVVGVGLYEFETNDVGLTEGIKRIWTA